MTTPAGYYDDEGNFIPGEFAGEIDLPEGFQVDQAKLSEAELELARAKKIPVVNKARLGAAQKRVRALEKQLKAKGLTTKQRKAIGAQLAVQRGRLRAATTETRRAVKQQPILQKRVYELSGQYEKLLEGDQRDAYAALRTMFDQYGLGTLAPKIYEYAKQGYGADVISLLLQDTSEYKTRFAANDVRVKKGLGVLSPAEYLATEQAYRQILQDAGLPTGFYDNPADFANWIGGDVSPTEIKGRVDLAVANSMQANPYAKEALQQLYGIDQSYVTAYYLDTKKALPLLQKQTQVAAYGAEALRRGLALTGANLEDFVTAGLSLSQVSAGFQQVAEELPNLQAIAARYQQAFTQAELEREIIAGTTAQAGVSRRRRLASQERGLFTGAGGATPGGLAAQFQAT